MISSDTNSQASNREQTSTRSIIVHYSEVGLKGKNRPLFVKQLKYNLQLKLLSIDLSWQVQSSRDSLWIPLPEDQVAHMDSIMHALQEVVGVEWLAYCKRVAHSGFRTESWDEDWRVLKENLGALAKEQYKPGLTFAVRVRRSDKRLPFQSNTLEPELGAFIQENTPWEHVNLKHPDVTFHVKLESKTLYLYTGRTQGPGGLPVGSAGPLLVLLSGGIDSPAAAYLAARRGCQLDFLHFTAANLTREEAQQQKIYRLARTLSRYTLASHLYLVPYTYFDMAQLGKPIRNNLVAFRRFMLRVGEKLAKEKGLKALITGDNLSQVASQTLSNMITTSQAVEMPVFRPLLTFNKQEIIQLAQRIGTYEQSIEPYKDCCALISRHPRTRSSNDQLQQTEKEAFGDYQEMIERTLKDTICFELGPGFELRRKDGSPRWRVAGATGD